MRYISPRRRFRPTITCHIFLALLALSGCDDIPFSRFDASSGALAACEEATKESLESPSSYKLLWSDYTKRGPISMEERKEMFLNGFCSPIGTKTCLSESDKFLSAYSYKELGIERIKSKLKAGKPLGEQEQKDAVLAGLAEPLSISTSADQTGFVLLEYESENRFGANLRSFGICRLGSIGSDARFDRADVLRFGPVPLDEGIAAKKQYGDVSNQ